MMHAMRLFWRASALLLTLVALATAGGCGTDAEPWPSNGYTPPTSTAVCGGHGTRFGGGGSCECDEGWDLDPNDITNCLPDAQTCGGHGDTTLDFNLEWTCTCYTGYELDPNDPRNCIATGGGGGGGGGGGDELTCEARDVAYGTGTGQTSCTFSWASCSDSATYDLACNNYYISGTRITECKCLRRDVEQGEPFYPDYNVCLVESWPTIEAELATNCGWTMSAGGGGGGGGGGGECPVGTCTAITGGSVCLEGGGIPATSPSCDPVTYAGCTTGTVPVTYTDSSGGTGCACLYEC